MSKYDITGTWDTDEVTKAVEKDRRY
jgi:hypothetical protein